MVLNHYIKIRLFVTTATNRVSSYPQIHSNVYHRPFATFRTGLPICSESAKGMDAQLPIALQMKSKLLDLVELKNAGAITEDEFVASKRELFANAVSTPTISTTPVMTVRCVCTST